ncbi:hypothetical protein N866_03215 [Actinotalea ferrariae CF5-4]|uniref:Uncharacterized protein n=1 Tax=Actinotalea ferrariae CF5-4 TaxID=948458 RepID=A0A021VUM5_9CELL|nr:hypothetical protein [Actinotalea ferrariae]EYR64869.1 hypothetical protein N866_03215 [Actinotalea ferrariae CF5-4]
MTADTFDPALRTRFGTPKRWVGPGRFGVVMAGSRRVVDRVLDPASGAWSELQHVDAAHDHAAALRRERRCGEFEVVRDEAGVWRDYLGRTPEQIHDARWATS